MEEFAAAVDDFLNFKRYAILQDKGKMSKKIADTKARSEYDIFNKTQVIESDFDKQIKKLVESEK